MLPSNPSEEDVTQGTEGQLSGAIWTCSWPLLRTTPSCGPQEDHVSFDCVSSPCNSVKRQLGPGSLILMHGLSIPQKWFIIKTGKSTLHPHSLFPSLTLPSILQPCEEQHQGAILEVKTGYSLDTSGLPRLQNCEEHISVLCKLPPLRYSVIAAQMDKDSNT